MSDEPKLKEAQSRSCSQLGVGNQFFTACFITLLHLIPVTKVVLILQSYETHSRRTLRSTEKGCLTGLKYQAKGKNACKGIWRLKRKILFLSEKLRILKFIITTLEVINNLGTVFLLVSSVVCAVLAVCMCTHIHTLTDLPSVSLL